MLQQQTKPNKGKNNKKRKNLRPSKQILLYYLDLHTQNKEHNKKQIVLSSLNSSIEPSNLSGRLGTHCTAVTDHFKVCL